MIARLCMIVLLLAPASALAQHMDAPGSGAAHSEYAVKAAFVYNFTKFVTWENGIEGGKDDPVVVGVLGADPFGAALKKAFRGKTIVGRSVVVRHFETPDEATVSTILFLGDGLDEHREWIEANLRTLPVLTISDDARFGERSVIHFCMHGHRVAFGVDLNLARQAGLRVSSRLLSLASVVKDGDGHE